MTQPRLPNTPVSHPESDAFRDHVLSIVETLPFRQAQALWHVDVCGASYATSARECGLSRRRFTKHLHDARKQVLLSLADGRPQPQPGGAGPTRAE